MVGVQAPPLHLGLYITASYAYQSLYPPKLSPHYLVIVGLSLQHPRPAGIVLWRQDIKVRAIIRAVYTGQREEHMWHGISHIRQRRSPVYSLHHIGMVLPVLSRCPYPERNLKFLSRKSLYYLCRVHTSREVWQFTGMHLFSVVRHVNDNGVLVTEQVCNSCHD